MPFVLREGFAEGGSDLGAAGGTPAAAAFEVFVDAMLFEEPVSLAGVAGEHLLFEVESRRDIEDELWLDRTTEPIGSLNRIDEIKMRNVLGRGSWLPLACHVIRNTRIETGVSEQLARHFVVGHVIDRWSC